MFSEDNSYPLLCSLEIVAEDGTLERKLGVYLRGSAFCSVGIFQISRDDRRTVFVGMVEIRVSHSEKAGVPVRKSVLRAAKRRD